MLLKKQTSFAKACRLRRKTIPGISPRLKSRKKPPRRPSPCFKTSPTSNRGRSSFLKSKNSRRNDPRTKSPKKPTPKPLLSKPAPSRVRSRSCSKSTEFCRRKSRSSRTSFPNSRKCRLVTQIRSEKLLTSSLFWRNKRRPLRAMPSIRARTFESVKSEKTSRSNWLLWPNNSRRRESAVKSWGNIKTTWSRPSIMKSIKICCLRKPLSVNCRSWRDWSRKRNSIWRKRKDLRKESWTWSRLWLKKRTTFNRPRSNWARKKSWMKKSPTTWINWKATCKTWSEKTAGRRKSW